MSNSLLAKLFRRTRGKDIGGHESTMVPTAYWIQGFNKSYNVITGYKQKGSLMYVFMMGTSHHCLGTMYMPMDERTSR